MNSSFRERFIRAWVSPFAFAYFRYDLGIGWMVSWRLTSLWVVGREHAFVVLLEPFLVREAAE